VWLTNYSANVYSLMNENGVWIPNPNTFERRSQNNVSEAKEKTILMVGRFSDPAKRLDKALVIFKEVLKTQHEAKLVLVGGYVASISDLVSSLKIPKKNIVFTGEQLRLGNIINRHRCFY